MQLQSPVHEVRTPSCATQGLGQSSLVYRAWNDVKLDARGKDEEYAATCLSSRYFQELNHDTSGEVRRAEVQD